MLFLSELLHFIEHENLAFERFKIELQGFTLHASLRGAAVQKFDKEIKAVTYHNIQVRRAAQGYRVNIVFDV